MEEFDKKLLLPSAELLLAMKINSLPGRDKDHKRIKDFCDIFALAWYSGLNPRNIKLTKYLSKDKLAKCQETVSDEDFLKAAIQLGHEKEEIKRIFEILFDE